jgi:hypothetical protein
MTSRISQQKDCGRCALIAVIKQSTSATTWFTKPSAPSRRKSHIKNFHQEKKDGNIAALFMIPAEFLSFRFPRPRLRHYGLTSNERYYFTYTPQFRH